MEFYNGQIKKLATIHYKNGIKETKQITVNTKKRGLFKEEIASIVMKSNSEIKEVFVRLYIFSPMELKCSIGFLESILKLKDYVLTKI